MSASARRRENQQRAATAAYPSAVTAALESEDFTHVSPDARVLGCPVCGNVIVGTCPHWAERLARRLAGEQTASR